MGNAFDPGPVPAAETKDGTVLAIITIRDVIVNGAPSVAADVDAKFITRRQLAACVALLAEELAADR